jgi:hypothetical protein
MRRGAIRIVRPEPVAPLSDHGGRLPLVEPPADGSPVMVEQREAYEFPLRETRLAQVWTYGRDQDGEERVCYAAWSDSGESPPLYRVDPFLFHIWGPRTAGSNGAWRMELIDPAEAAEIVAAFSALPREARGDAWRSAAEIRERTAPEGRLRLTSYYDDLDPDPTYELAQLLADGTAIEVPLDEEVIATFFPPPSGSAR